MISLRMINNMGDKCMRRMMVINRKEKDGNEMDNGESGGKYYYSTVGKKRMSRNKMTKDRDSIGRLR